jgi:hypothetical protein
MDTPIVLDGNGLLAAWHGIASPRLVATAEGVMRERYELNAFGEVVANGQATTNRPLSDRAASAQTKSMRMRTC